MTHSLAVPHKVSAWVAVEVLLKPEGPRMTKLLIKRSGKGDGKGDVNTSSPNMMQSNVYAKFFFQISGN